MSNEPERRKGGFKYFNMWGKAPEFTATVQRVWSTQILGYKMFQFVKKLKLLKPGLKQMNGEVFGNTETSANVAKLYLYNVQKQLHNNDPNNMILQQTEREATISYRELEEARRSFLAQKSKAQWMEDGDDNTQYFHSVLKGRRMSNMVFCIQDLNGNNCSTAQAIEEAFVGYYVHLLGTSKTVTPVHVPTVRTGTIVNAKQSQALIQEVTTEEIKQALSSIPANKPPGPDGYTSQFYKDAFDIVGENLVDAIKEFFKTGKLLTQVNSTVLTLVPKKTRPVSVADFRPIACCNVVYKIISKVMCNRLVPILPNIVSVTQSAFIKGRAIADNILICHDLVRLYNRKACSPRCIIKVDLKKAYDSIEWKFIEQMLGALGFPERMVDWIMACGEIDYILSYFGFKPGKFPFRYFGVPISYKHLAIGDCTRLIEKIVGRIRGWGAKKLSYAGRMVLIKSVLSQLHTFWSRIFVIPTTVIARIECICRNYLWSGSELYNRALAVSWDKVCKDRRYGVLGIINYKLWNEATIGKYVWWIAVKTDHLWIRWVNHIYIKGQAWMDYKPTCNTSCTWRRICHVKDIMKPGYTNCLWTGNSGEYSVSKGYKWLRGVQVKCDWFPLIWNKSAFPKHSFVGWLAVKGRLFTKERMQGFRLHTNGLFPLNDVVHWSARWRSRSLLKNHIVPTAILALWYHLWDARNVCRIEAKLFTPSFIIQQVKCEVQYRCRQKLMTSKFQLPEILTGVQAD
ncbi:uncharacterized protein LOC141658117 [Silene latifolia]|uniref:uncharacterized protein LOC141658117 n=1 Tax=Silene latifolia TaxID=37657 RepID=UPI003D771986